MKTWFRNANQYLTRTTGPWVKNPNASGASYKPKQVSFIRTKLRLYKREYLIQKLIFFTSEQSVKRRIKRIYVLGLLSVGLSSGIRTESYIFSNFRTENGRFVLYSAWFQKQKWKFPAIQPTAPKYPPPTLNPLPPLHPPASLHPLTSPTPFLRCSVHTVIFFQNLIKSTCNQSENGK